MKFASFIKKYDGKVIEDDGCVMSTEARRFVTAFRTMLKSELPDCTIKMHAGHYDLSGFVIAPSEKITYISYFIQRGNLPLDFARTDPMGAVLYRSAQSDKDFHGGPNHFCAVARIKDLCTFAMR